MQGRNNARARASKPVRQLMLLVGAGVVAAAAAPSAAEAGWSIQPAPRPAHAGDTELFGVSCTSTRDCMAVGQSVVASTGNAIPLVEHWNGSRWSIQPTPIRTANDWQGALTDVSCSSSTACMAVGAFDTDNWSGPLAERWNGSSWSLQRIPQSIGAEEFFGVSCASSTGCIAVGGGQASFAQRWDGKRWSFENIRFGDLQGRANELTDVSCPSRGTCAAVGTDDIGLCGDDYSDYLVPVLGLWRSGRWSLRRHPNLGCSNTYIGENELNALSCTSTTACTAVGTAVYRWDGHHWSIQPAANGGDELLGVSCTSRNACTAVGSRGYTWNGHGWSSQPISSPSGTTGELYSVSCTSPGSCVAVGKDENHAGWDSLLIEVSGR